MYLRMARRLLLETDKRLLWKLAWNMGFRGMRSVQKHKQRLKRGQFFPPFLYLSIINSCNLRCQGCWVDVSAKQQTIDLEAMNRTIAQARAMGNSFFGILGGEPFMHPQLLPILASHPDCYFQVFTNGQFITDEVARELRKLGNVTPLVSIEGSAVVSDERRGRPEVFSKSMAGVENCIRHRVFTGVCTSLCQTNIDDLLQESWVDRLIELGVMYLWYHVYRPVGPEATPSLALTPEQQLRARRFVVEMRCRKPIVIIDAYYDGQGQALCPAATGFTHHVGPGGDIEPCPIIQFATESIHDPRPLRETFNESVFLREFRELAASATRGCIVLERPDLLKSLVEKHGARDTTSRGTALAELEAMEPRPSQYHPGEEVPERSLAYRFVKRHFFHDFGAYAKFDPAQFPTPAGAAVARGAETPAAG
jgi:MoaA/NifB/PqqE/SkfB family radical SAM enzyme